MTNTASVHLKGFFVVLLVILVAKSSLAQFQPLTTFVTKGFTVLDSASGDLNRDGKKDLVLILRNKAENINPDTTRPLLILQGNGSGQFKLLSRNDHVVLCLGCGGVFGDPYEDITIKNGYFSIEHFGGSNWKWTRIITFRFDSKTRQFVLHRDAGLSWHSSEPNKQTENLHNKEDFGIVNFEKYSYTKGW